MQNLAAACFAFAKSLIAILEASAFAEYHIFAYLFGKQNFKYPKRCPFKLIVLIVSLCVVFYRGLSIFLF